MCVCVCVCSGIYTLWGHYVPTRIAILVHFELVGTFLGPHGETAYKSYRIKYFENVKMQKVLSEG